MYAGRSIASRATVHEKNIGLNIPHSTGKFWCARMKSPESIFNQLREEAETDPNIIGFFLGGSRGKGFATEHSDYDVYIIVKDGFLESHVKLLRKRFPVHDYYKWTEHPILEKLEVKNFGGIMVVASSQFEKTGPIGSSDAWNRYNYTHLRVLVDKNGRIQKLVDYKGTIEKERVQNYVSARLDGYINSVYRSLKCFRDSNSVGARLEAADSIQYFLNVIFGLEGRITPYYKYLEWELEKFPLKKFKMKPMEIVRSLLQILEDADVETQKRLLEMTETACRKEGYGNAFDDWGPDLVWITNFAK
jgi:predicted nucleotidyltransferase